MFPRISLIGLNGENLKDYLCKKKHREGDMREGGVHHL
jgi:hypothetical protein